MNRKSKMKKRGLIVNIAASFKEAKEFSDNYELSLTPEQRLSSMEFLREQYYLMKNYEDKPRLQRVIRIIKQK